MPTPNPQQRPLQRGFCCILSIFLTIIGAWVGTKSITLDPLRNFFYRWPRNFFIAFWVEALIAQPVARLAMKKIHAQQARKLASGRS
ncbi:hypothetical protein [Paenibacillus graminis]|uniref:hypothetical protein n=1 Tax=Paenibacillus graminis TaxID=189425 RepID=UPI002DB5F600|nr:hypothetical protein [Paenibacillus graminis]MEC0169441.1 hypothetical protein [Paenibacillus graminis]